MAGTPEYLDWCAVAVPDGEVGFACPDCLSDGELRAVRDYIIDITPRDQDT